MLKSCMVFVGSRLHSQFSKNCRIPERNVNIMTCLDSSTNIVWVDLEMTGLDIENDHILEMACLITDADLNIIAESRDLVIHQSRSVMENMNDWCKEQHGKTGLTNAVLQSKTSIGDAEKEMLEFVQKYCPVANTNPLAGNSIHVDKMFLKKYMPSFVNHLHYRIIDVSTIKELSKRWFPQVLPPLKCGNHRAMSDIHESIKELMFYRKTIFKSPETISKI